VSTKRGTGAEPVAFGQGVRRPVEHGGNGTPQIRQKTGGTFDFGASDSQINEWLTGIVNRDAVQGGKRFGRTD